MAIADIYVHADSALNGSGSSRILHEGSFVSVRILAKNGPQMYTASFAGGRFNVTSRQNLEPGAVFRARVVLDDGKIMLVPEKQTAAEAVSLQNYNSEVFSSQPGIPLADSSLASSLLSLGLPPDIISLRLVQQLQQLGVRFDVKLLGKIRAAAAHFPGHEAEAAEAALILEEKGIESSDDAIERVIFTRDFSNSGEAQPDRSFAQSADVGGTAAADDADIAGDVLREMRRYIHTVFDENGTVQKNRPGFLTLYNHSGSGSFQNDGFHGHWILLPFDLSYGISAGRQSGHGIMRIFSDIGIKKSRKIIINFETDRQKSFYVVCLQKNGKYSKKKVLFCIQPEPADKESLKTRLHEFIQSGPGDSVNVEWIPPEKCSPFYTEDTPFTTVQGSV